MCAPYGSAAHGWWLTHAWRTGRGVNTHARDSPRATLALMCFRALCWGLRCHTRAHRTYYVPPPPGRAQWVHPAVDDSPEGWHAELSQTCNWKLFYVRNVTKPGALGPEVLSAALASCV